MRKQTKRFAALLLALTLGLTAVWAAAPTAAAAAGSDGIVRVLLTRLQLTDRLDIALDGSYSLEPLGITFQRGSKLVVSAAPQGLLLFYEGMALRLETLTLSRHAINTVEENGLRLNGGFSLYTGDLLVTNDNGSLRAVLHAPMEEYLLGVVPYEMSDSFPLEALKAQAVTARTYAQRKLGGKLDYDVVDNTNDQVYKGMNAEHTQALRAVQETRGICGYIGKQLAQCYYTASNGGQTELMTHVWGGKEELFIVQEDPYDAKNPLSEVRRFSLPRKVPQTGLGNDALTALLLAALAEPLQERGYDGGAERTRLLGIEAATVHTPAFPEPSRLMTKLRLSLRVAAQRQVGQLKPEVEDTFPEAASLVPEITPAPTPEPKWSAFEAVPEPIEIDLNIFPDVEAALNLSINGDNNEIVTVTETEKAFLIEARRFGHGVGMSQRGAEWLAGQEGWNYAQILQFYYPDIRFNVVTATATLLPAVDAAFLTTPGPAASPTPRPTLMPLSEQPADQQWVATVTKIGTGSTLNLRLEPNTQSGVQQMLYYGQRLLVLEELEGGWLKVKTDAAEGYVMSSFVEKEGEAAAEAVDAASESGETETEAGAAAETPAPAATPKP